jgi:hypothetical protein
MSHHIQNTELKTRSMTKYKITILQWTKYILPVAITFVYANDTADSDLTIH